MSLENISLGEVADITKLAGFEFTKYIEYLEHGEIIALRALNLRNGSLDLSDVKYISKEVSESLPRSKLYKNDILLTYTGNGYGDCAIVKENDKYHLAPNIAKITPKKINPYYLFEFINSKYFKKQMRNFIGGSSQPTIPMKTLRILEIPFPKEETQNKIAVILSNINKKIEINKEINKNLENFLKNIFFQWFVKFENFNGAFKDSELGEIPENWKVLELKDLVKVIDNRGKTPPLVENNVDYPIIDVRALNGDNRIINFDNCSKYVDKDTYDNWFRSGHPKDFDILISTVGSIAELKLFLGSKGCLAQNVVAFRPKKGYGLYLYQYLRYIKKDLEAYNIGSVQPSIKVTHILKHSILIPDDEVLDTFNNLSLNITVLLYNNSLEIQQLTDLRDSLLPKLMSGEIDVSKINCD